jgi:hypothetical protein
MSCPLAKGSALRRIAVVLLAGVLVTASLLWLLRTPIRTYLSSVTGEENPWEQIKGLGRLFTLRLTRPPLQLEPYAPMAHAGVSPFGVNTFLEQEVEPAKVEKALQMIHAAGFRWIRQEFPWEDIEQSAKGDFWDHKWNVSAWEKYDRIVDLANQYDIQVIARLGNPPAWSRTGGDAKGTFAPPDDLQDLGDFVHAVVSRYEDKVTYYQIWNEPNIYPEWGEQPVDAAGYVRLLQTAYRRAKEADPECVVLCAGLAQTLETGPRNLSDLVYLQQMYDAGAQGYFDIMGVMAYGLWTGPGDHRAGPELTNFSRPQLIRDIMVRNGDADKPLWATEVGWNAVPADFPAFPLYGRVTQEQQARYAVQAYQRAQQEWPWMGVLNYWFFKRAADTETDQVFYYFRLVEPDFGPLPAYEAVKAYANQPPRVHIGYHQEDHWALAWEGDWREIRDEQAVLGSFRRSTTPGEVLRGTFEGTDLHLVVRQSPQGGMLGVTIDGQAMAEVSLRSESTQYEVRIPVAQDLRDGPHELLIENVGPVGTLAEIDGLLVQRWPRLRLSEVALAVVAVMTVLALRFYSRTTASDSSALSA